MVWRLGARSNGRVRGEYSFEVRSFGGNSRAGIPIRLANSRQFINLNTPDTHNCSSQLKTGLKTGLILKDDMEILSG